jgi:hypothetical protein
VLLVSLVTVFACACAKESPKVPDKLNTEKPAQSTVAEEATDGLVNAIKKGKLVNYQSTTIGNAFESYKYLTKKEWKSESLKSRHFTVDFTGWFGPDTLNDSDIKNGVTGKGINVKFVINTDGSYYVFMVSKIESSSDGKVSVYELQDSAGILANIYANKKISL